MSVINKMLQDLDRRQAVPASGAADGGRNVRAVRLSGGGHEWFWRIVAFLMLVALAWVGWVAYQLQPRPLATELAQQSARVRTTKPAAPSPTPVAAAPAKPAPLAESAPPPPPPELFKLAQSIQTPIGAPAAKAAAPAATAKREAKATAGTRGLQVNRRDHPRTASEDAEIAFRAGVNRLNQGRTSEAAQQFAS